MPRRRWTTASSFTCRSTATPSPARKIEIIRKDTGGIAPDVAKRLAQELVVRDGVDILAGFVLTPNAMAAGDVSMQAKKFMVDDECRDLDHHHQVALHGAHLGDRCRRSARRSATWAVKKAACKKAYTMVSDYGPGHDCEGAFQPGFKEAGGEIIGSVRCRSPIRISRPSCSAPRISIRKAIFVFVPGGAQPAALGKAFAERGIDPEEDQGHRQRRNRRRERDQEYGRCAPRHHHRLALRLRPQVGEERRLREGLQCRQYGASPTSCRSAAMTACSSSTSR